MNIPWMSVIIPTYGTKGVSLTAACVESLRRTHAHIRPQIIIVSDGDEGLSDLEAIGKEHEATVIAQDRGGFAKACNAGLSQSDGMVSFLVNNDVEFIEPTTLQTMATALDATGAGIIGCRLLYPDYTIQHAGVVFVPGQPDQPLPGWFDHLYRKQPALHTGAVTLRPGMVTGGFMGITQWALLTVGFLDDRFGFTCEDIDYNMRVIEAGRAPWYCGYACAIHKEGATGGHAGRETEIGPDVLEREIESLRQLFLKYPGFNWNQLGVHQQ